MKSNSQKYYSNLLQAKVIIDQKIAEIEGKITHEYDELNYYDVLANLQNSSRHLSRFLNLHKFHHLSKEDFVAQFDLDESRRLEFKHTVKDFESPQVIADKYGVSLKAILLRNNITTDEITTGTELYVDAKNDFNREAYDNIPTFGSQIGDLVFGRDFYNSIAEDNNSDISVAEPTSTIKQGITNRVTTKEGDYSLVDFGLQLVGSEFPLDLKEGIEKMKVAQRIEEDPRIKKVIDINAEYSGNSVIYKADIETVNRTEINI